MPHFFFFLVLLMAVKPLEAKVDLVTFDGSSSSGGSAMCVWNPTH